MVIAVTSQHRMASQRILLTHLLALLIDHCGSYMISTTTTSGIAFLCRRGTRSIHQYHCRKQAMRSLQMSSLPSDAVASDVKVASVLPSPLVGDGTYIGLSSTFDVCHSLGHHIPIDERYIPSSLLEWGYVPTTLETISFESSSRRSNSTSATDMTRSVYTILPATGCDNDNLETIATTEQYSDGRTSATAASSSIIYDKSTSNCNTISIETCFRWIPEDTPNASGKTDIVLTDELYRIRINIEIQQKRNEDNGSSIVSAKRWKIINPLRVSIEKQLDTTSIHIDPNSIKSGGLDSRTITQLLGPILHSESMRSFPTQEPLYPPEFAHCDGSEMITIPGNISVSTLQANRGNGHGDGAHYQIDVGYILSTSKNYIVASHQIPVNYSTRDDLSRVNLSTRLVGF